jgi:hypothetical protein
VLTHVHPCTLWFASKGAPLFTGPTSSGYSWSCQVPRAPLHEPGVTSLVVISWTTSAGITPPSSLLRTHAPILHPPRASVVPSNTRSLQVAVSPCWEEDLPDVTLRIFPYVLGPLPRPLLRCMYPLFPARQRPSPREDKVGAQPRSVQRLQYGALLRGCSHSIMFRPAGLLATQVAPTDTDVSVWQP